MSSDLQTLEKRLAALESEVATLRAARTGTMRDTRCCPACGDRSILHFTSVTEQTAGGLRKLSLAHSTSWKGTTAMVPLEAYACRACGKVEWYATGLDDVEVDGTLVKLLESTGPETPPDAGPYR